MPDPATQPWLNSAGELAHPDAPRGGGGPGVSRNPRPLGTGAGANPRAIPAPGAGAARSLTPTELADKVGDGDPKTPADLEKERQQANQNLAIYVAQTAEELVGKPSVGRKQCFDLLDKILKDSGGKSADDFERVTGKRDQDYKWGEPVADLKDIRPGDLIQFRNFVTTYSTRKGDDTRTYELTRGPQHSSIVISKNADGTLEIAEQHVMDHETDQLSEVIKHNRLEYKPRQYNLPDGSAVTVTVSGSYWFYHPVAKPKPAAVKTPR